MNGPDKKVFAKNYDWNLGHGYLLTNKRNVQKNAIMLKATQVPLQWTSKFASVTFNQYGQELPNSGMNEKGLAIEILWLDQSVYPTADTRPEINELQWVQFHLDNYSSTAELVSNADKVRMNPVFAKVHYLVCDSTGECATIEYQNGKLVTHTAEKLRPRLLTNSFYSESRDSLKPYMGFGGTKEIPEGTASLERFARAAFNLKCAEATTERAFDILEMVRQGDYTKWQVAYDLTEQTIAFKTAANPNLRTLKASFNPSCKSEVLAHDLEAQSTGEVSSLFSTYTPEQNRKLIEKSFVTLGPLGKVLGERVAAYPASTLCKE